MNSLTVAGPRFGTCPVCVYQAQPLGDLRSLAEFLLKALDFVAQLGHPASYRNLITGKDGPDRNPRRE